MIEACLDKREAFKYRYLKNSEEIFNYTEVGDQNEKIPILAKFHGTFFEHDVNNLELVADLGSIRFWPRDIWRDWTNAQSNIPGYPLMKRITSGKWLFVFGYSGRDDFDVSAPRKAWHFLQGVSPCRVRSNQPPVSSVA
jgi:hypothetical protein